MPTLHDAIEQLYRAFGGTPKPHHIDGCPCCIDRKELEERIEESWLLRAPKRLATAYLDARR